MSNDHRELPLVLVIFGITGDLAQRKLLPALYHLQQAGDLPEKTRIVGVSRRHVAVKDVYYKLPQFVTDASFDETVAHQLQRKTEMVQMGLLDAADYKQLLTHLASVEKALGPKAVRLYYLSIPPQVFMPIVRNLGNTGHNAPLPGFSDAPRLLVEKPFGYDTASAQELIAAINQHFGEGQVYRIDHYVAKETVQNILTFRFQNPLFEGIWNNRHISEISVVAHEQIGIENRAAFYEQTGALRDLVQSHLLQLLAMTTMARPERLESREIHKRKLELLEAVVPIAPDKVAKEATRGQYAGYREEVQNPDSFVETFARLQLSIDNDQWRGVPVTLETGKALAAKKTEITVCFDRSEGGAHERNRLVFRIQPSEGITIGLEVKSPGIDNRTDTAEMDFDYQTAFKRRTPDAYERVIVDAIRGDQTLFATADEVMASWRVVQHVVEEWAKNDTGLVKYDPGATAVA